MTAVLGVLAAIGAGVVCFVALALIQCPVCSAWCCPAAKHPWPPKIEDDDQ